MSGEIQLPHSTTGVVLYAVMRSGLSKAVKASDGSLVTYATANLSQYTITLTEQGTASCFYVGDVPAGVVAGVYGVTVYQRIGVSPAEGDTRAGGGDIQWDGTAIVPLSSRFATAGYTAPPTAAAVSAQVASDLAAAHGAGSWATAAGFSTLTTADIDARLEAFDPPTNAEMVARTLPAASYALEATGQAVKARTDALPPDPADASDIAAAFAAVPAAVSAAITADHGVGSYIRNTEPDNAGIAVSALVAAHLATAIELDGGLYRFTVAALANAPSTGLNAAGVRAAVGLAAANLDAQLAEIEAETDDIAGIAAKLNTIGTGGITVVSPVSPDGASIHITQGDDYKLADGRQLAFTVGAGLPSLAGAAVRLNISDGLLVIVGVITASGAGTQHIYFEMTAAQTAALGRHSLPFDVTATLADADRITLLTGTMSVADTQAN